MHRVCVKIMITDVLNTASRDGQAEQKFTEDENVRPSAWVRTTVKFVPDFVIVLWAY